MMKCITSVCQFLSIFNAERDPINDLTQEAFEVSTDEVAFFC